MTNSPNRGEVWLVDLGYVALLFWLGFGDTENYDGEHFNQDLRKTSIFGGL